MCRRRPRRSAPTFHAESSSRVCLVTWAETDCIADEETMRNLPSRCFDARWLPPAAALGGRCVAAIDLSENRGAHTFAASPKRLASSGSKGASSARPSPTAGLVPYGDCRFEFIAVRVDGTVGRLHPTLAADGPPRSSSGDARIGCFPVLRCPGLFGYSRARWATSGACSTWLRVRTSPGEARVRCGGFHKHHRVVRGRVL